MILSKRKLEEMLFSSEIDLKQKIIITPLIDRSQIGDGTIDIRLGNRFVYLKKYGVISINPSDENIEQDIKKYQEMVYRKFGESFILHPGEFVLGSSLEYIRLPPNISGKIVGRS